MILYNYPDILTVEEVMNILHIGRGQCYDYLNRGILKAFKINTKTWKIPRESVEEYISTRGYTFSASK